MDTLRAVITHDHPVVGAGILILETARHLCADLAPDMLLIEMTLADEITPPLAEQTETAMSRPQVFVLRGHHTGAYVFGLLPGGSAIAPTKHNALQLIAETIQAGLDGDADRRSHRIVVQVPPQQLEGRQALTPDLTAREVEILRQLTAGKTNQAMSQHLGITERTVEFHLSNIYKKLEVKRRSEAIAWARRAGLVEE